MVYEFLIILILAILIISVGLLFLYIIEIMSDRLDGESNNKDRKGHIKYLGEGYYKVVSKLYGGKETFPREWGRLREMLEMYIETPEDYYIIMLKYEYSFILINSMIEEAEDLGVNEDERLIKKVVELVEILDEDFTRVQKDKEGKEEEARTIGVNAINKQIEEEIKLLKGIKDMQREINK